METQFMGEKTEDKMATKHMIERTPWLYHEIWHEAWREAWEASTAELVAMLRNLTDFTEDMVGDWPPFVEQAKSLLKNYERPA